MSEEQMLERRGPLDTIESVGMAALAVGAGAALLYRGHGSEFLSSGLKRTTKFLSEVSNDIPAIKRAFLDGTGKDEIKSLYKKHISNKDSTWKEISSEVGSKVSLRTDTPRSLSNVMKTMFQLRNNPVAMLSEKYDTEMIYKLKSELRELAQDDKALMYKIDNFIQDSVKHFSESTPAKDEMGMYVFSNKYVEKHLKNTKLNDLEIDIMQTAIAHAVELKKDELPKYIKENQYVIDLAIERLENEVANKYKTQSSEGSLRKLADSALGHRRATVKDVVELRDQIDEETANIYTLKDEEKIKENVIDMFQKQIDKNKEFGDLVVDNALYVKLNEDGERTLVDYSYAADIKKKVINEFANTLPGKLLKARDMIEIADAPIIDYFGSGKFDPILAAIAEKSNKSIIKEDYLRIYNKTYKISKDSLDHVSELDDTYLISSKHGTMPGMIRHISGDINYAEKDQSKLASWLDIGNTTKQTKFKNILSSITKFADPKWGRNLVSSFLDTDVNEVGLASLIESDGASKFVVEYFERVRDLNRFFNESTNKLDKHTINKLMGHISSSKEDVLAFDSAKDILSLLAEDDEELIRKLVKKDQSKMFNKDLESMIKSYLADSSNARKKVFISSDNKLIFSETKGMDFVEMIRKEVAKESFLRHRAANGGKLDSIANLLRDSKITGQALKETKNLANWAMFQVEGNVFSSSLRKTRDMYDLKEDMLQIQRLFSGTTEPGKFNENAGFLRDFREDMATMAREKSSVFQRGFDNDKQIVYGNDAGDWMFMRKSIKALDVIKNINDFSKLKAFGKQFVAGRGNMQDVTTATLFPYFGLFRLTEPLSEIGIGFSPKSTGSVGDLAYNIMTRRVLPIAGALTALSYLDYESKNFTGTSLRGAAANSLASLDLGVRRTIDTFGLTQHFEDSREINPMAQYWRGEDYQSYEERLEWYKNGYTPIRKGRWWSFGSTSEFRGGKISFYDQNYLKRAHSDWKDIGVYGSVEEKWAHSWIPTPRHPFSTLRALTDPYWLERKHYWDRPYPVTGKLFGEDFPWSGPLNATVGQIIKPRRQMHQNELQGSLVDIRSIIGNINASTKAKAQSGTGLVKVDGTGQVAPVSFTPLNPQQMNIQSQEELYAIGGVGAWDQSGPSSEPLISGYSAMAIQDYEPVHDALQEKYMTAVGTQISSFENAKLSWVDQLRISDSSGIVEETINKVIPKELIAPINESIKARANARIPIAPRGGDDGIITADAIFKTQARSSLGLLSDSDVMSDLRNISSTKESLQDTAYSMKELGGMYGFLFEQVFPSSKTKRLQSADRMTSFSRGFWDSTVGGAGGAFMEIARRFFPHEDHSKERINTIRNTMPDWMPERFKTGDPYQSVPKGEMRLPGPGYEDINKLHSDQYGKYGAFDRMKILGDIAPWSREYRIWRDIAQKTVTDPDLKQEIKAVKNRVAEQSKTHEFFPYKFLGTKLTSQKAIISEVTESSFTIMGSNEEYKMAGLKFKKGTSLGQFIQPGMPVRLQTDANKYTRANADGTISAIIMTDEGNLNRKLLSEKLAEERKDQSVAGMHARLTQTQIEKGKVFELLAHAPIPFIHNKFMRVNTAIESYKDEQIYGTPYATWTHPIQGFITPSFQKAWGQSGVHAAMGIAAWGLSAAADKSSSGPIVKGLAKTAFLATNPGAFAGATTGFALRLGGGPYVRWGTKIGATVGLLGYTAVHANNPLFTAASGAVTGYQLAEWLSKGTGKKGALYGSLAGLAVSAIKNPDFDKDRMFGPYMPKKTKKRWEIQEYYDRLSYIKYSGLFEKAARKAKHKEGIDIKRILNKMEYDSEEREKIKNRLLESKQKISNIYSGDQNKVELLNKINAKLEMLNYPERVLKAGKYTRAALAYKQAAESTIYGMKENATWSQILRAMPKNERDYIIEFSKERDPKKRKEILKYVAPYFRKPLQISWGQKSDKLEDNDKYFANHKLPNLFWAGWQPDVDLDNVQIKTIKNEGMLLSDFGIYESQAETYEAQNAPVVDMHQQTSPIELRKNLLTALNGMGLVGVDVSIEPSLTPGIQMLANITRITDYKVKEKINNTLGRIFY